MQKYNKLNAFHNFAGAQPVSFQQQHMDTIQQDQTLVCEKTDGMRFFLVETNDQHFFLVDRMYNIKQIFVYNCEKFMAQKYIEVNTQNHLQILNIYDGELV